MAPSRRRHSGQCCWVPRRIASRVPSFCSPAPGHHSTVIPSSTVTTSTLPLPRGGRGPAGGGEWGVAEARRRCCRVHRRRRRSAFPRAPRLDGSSATPPSSFPLPCGGGGARRCCSAVETAAAMLSSAPPPPSCSRRSSLVVPCSPAPRGLPVQPSAGGFSFLRRRVPRGGPTSPRPPQGGCCRSPPPRAVVDRNVDLSP